MAPRTRGRTRERRWSAARRLPGLMSRWTLSLRPLMSERDPDGAAVPDLVQDGRGDGSGDFVGDVLDVVDAIPPGRVMSYGDVAACLGRGGPRQVGRVMAVWGGAVAWWRVVHADGSP